MNNGICESIDKIGMDYGVAVYSAADQAGTAQGFLYGSWDGHKTHACVCDKNFFGPDCSLHSCPLGDDPLTKGQSKRTLRMYSGTLAHVALGGGATRTAHTSHVGLKVLGHSAKWPISSNAAAVKTALEKLDAVYAAEVSASIVSPCPFAFGSGDCAEWTVALTFQEAKAGNWYTHMGNPLLSDFICDVSGLHGGLTISNVVPSSLAAGFIKVTMADSDTVGAVFCEATNCASSTPLQLRTVLTSNISPTLDLTATQQMYVVNASGYDMLQLTFEYTTYLTAESWLINTKQGLVSSEIYPELAGCKLEDAERTATVFQGAGAQPFTGARTTTYAITSTDENGAIEWSSDRVSVRAVGSIANPTVIGSEGLQLTFSGSTAMTVGQTWRVTAFAPTVTATTNFSSTVLRAYTDTASTEGLFFGRVSTAGVGTTNAIAFWCAPGKVTNPHASCQNSYADAVGVGAGFSVKPLVNSGHFTTTFVANAANSDLTVFWSHLQGFAPNQEWAFFTDIHGGVSIVPRPLAALEVELGEFWVAGQWLVTIDTAADNAQATFSAMEYNAGFPPLESRQIKIRPYYWGNYPDDDRANSLEGHGVSGIILRFRHTGCDLYTTPDVDGDSCFTSNPFQIGQRWSVTITATGNLTVVPVEQRIPVDSYHQSLWSTSSIFHSVSNRLRVQYIGGSLEPDSTLLSAAKQYKRRYFVEITNSGDYATGAPGQFVLYQDDNAGGVLAVSAPASIDPVNGNDLDTAGGKGFTKLYFSDAYMYAPGQSWEVNWVLPQQPTSPTAGMTFNVTSVRSVHEAAPCANRGRCDTNSGKCTCFNGFRGPNCAEITATTENAMDKPSLLVKSTGSTFRSNVLQVESEKGAASDFKLISASSAGSEQFHVDGQGNIFAKSLEATALQATQLEVGSGGITVDAGGLQVKQGGASIKQGGLQVQTTEDAVNTLLRATVADFGTTLLDMQSVQSGPISAAKMTNFHFISAANYETGSIEGINTFYDRVFEVLGDGTVNINGQTAKLLVKHAGATIGNGGLVVKAGVGTTAANLDSIVLVEAIDSFYTGNGLLMKIPHTAASNAAELAAFHHLRVQDGDGDVLRLEGSGRMVAERGLSVTTGGATIAGGGLRVQNGGATIESGTLYANDINTGSLVVRTGGIIFEDDTDAVDILTLRSTLSSASYTQSILRLDVATTSSPASAADFIIGNRAGSATFRVSPFGDVHIGHFADSAASLAAAEYMAIEMDHTGGAETAYFRSHLADMHIVTGHPTIRTISSSLNIEALAATTGNVAGGAISLVAASSAGSGATANGGNVRISSGDGANAAGSIVLQSGAGSTATATGGNIQILGGAGNAALGGSLSFKAGAGSPHGTINLEASDGSGSALRVPSASKEVHIDSTITSIAAGSTIQVYPQAAAAAVAGGDLLLSAGAAADGAGGTLSLMGGTTTGTGAGGDIYVSAGDTGSGTAGSVFMQSGGSTNIAMQVIGPSADVEVDGRIKSTAAGAALTLQPKDGAGAAGGDVSVAGGTTSGATGGALSLVGGQGGTTGGAISIVGGAGTTRGAVVVTTHTSSALEVNGGSTDVNVRSTINSLTGDLTLNAVGSNKVIVLDELQVAGTLSSAAGADLTLTPPAGQSIIMSRTVTTPSNTDLTLQGDGTGKVVVDDEFSSRREIISVSADLTLMTSSSGALAVVTAPGTPGTRTVTLPTSQAGTSFTICCNGCTATETVTIFGGAPDGYVTNLVGANTDIVLFSTVPKLADSNTCVDVVFDGTINRVMGGIGKFVS